MKIKQNILQLVLSLILNYILYKILMIVFLVVNYYFLGNLQNFYLVPEIDLEELYFIIYMINTIFKISIVCFFLSMLIPIIRIILMLTVRHTTTKNDFRSLVVTNKEISQYFLMSTFKLDIIQRKKIHNVCYEDELIENKTKKFINK